MPTTKEPPRARESAPLRSVDHLQTHAGPQQRTDTLKNPPVRHPFEDHDPRQYKNRRQHESVPNVNKYSSTANHPIPCISTRRVEPATDTDQDSGEKNEPLKFRRPAQRTIEGCQCPFMGHRFTRVAQPGGQVKTMAVSCGVCDYCVRFRIHLKTMQFAHGAPAPLQTVLTFTADHASHAREYMVNRQHPRRIEGARRINIMHLDESPSDDNPYPTVTARLIWDGAMAEHEMSLSVAHAIKQGMTNVSITQLPVTEELLKEWIPLQLRIKGPGDKHVNATHFGWGWANVIKQQKDWRDGRTEMVSEDKIDDPAPGLQQSARSEAIRKSWEDVFANLEPNHPKALHDAELKRALPYLERARYINCQDWLSGLTDKDIKEARELTLKLVKGQQPSLRKWHRRTEAPVEPLLETASWLQGQRGREPALTLWAERMGIVNMKGQPHIDPDWLADLVDTLPPLDS